MPAPSTLTPYLPGLTPGLPEANPNYAPNEFKKIADASAAAVNMIPQVAVAAPKTLKDGMIRLARSPWRPIGGSVDAWVYYDAPTSSWKAL